MKMYPLGKIVHYYVNFYRRCFGVQPLERQLKVVPTLYVKIKLISVILTKLQCSEVCPKNEQRQTRRNLISSDVALESPLTPAFFELIATTSRL